MIFISRFFFFVNIFSLEERNIFISRSNRPWLIRFPASQKGKENKAGALELFPSHSVPGSLSVSSKGWCTDITAAHSRIRAKVSRIPRRFRQVGFPEPTPLPRSPSIERFRKRCAYRVVLLSTTAVSHKGR